VLTTLYSDVDYDEGLMQKAVGDNPAGKWSLIVVI
jgi:hypothetical protein